VIDSATIWDLVEAGGKLIAPAGIVGAAIYAVLRWRLSEDFAKKDDLKAAIDGIGKRLDRVDGDIEKNGEAMRGVERRLAAMPGHEDIREMFRRLAGVEASLSGTVARIEGVSALLANVAHQVSLLTQNELDGEKRK